MILTITDAFLIGDRFSVSIDGGPALYTSVPGTGGSCGSDPAVCILDPNVSSGIFLLSAGAHSITINVTTAPFGSGAAYFRVDTLIPEPATWMLLGIGFAGMGLLRLKRRV